MEAHSNPKMEAHSAPEKQTHSVPEMETQSWQGIFLEKNDNFSKCIEPQERNILAPDLFAVTWHQISESQPTQKNYEMVTASWQNIRGMLWNDTVFQFQENCTTT